MIPIHTYRYGSPRKEGEGLRIGVARQPPRGVKKEEWQARGYFDARAIALAPSQKLVSAFRHGEIPFEEFKHRYFEEMKSPESREMIGFVAAMSLYQPISLGCFCEDEHHCHRTLLREIISQEAQEKAALFATQRTEGEAEPGRNASPVCYADFAKNLPPG